MFNPLSFDVWSLELEEPALLPPLKGLYSCEGGGVDAGGFPTGFGGGVGCAGCVVSGAAADDENVESAGGVLAGAGVFVVCDGVGGGGGGG
jgi:hypothetical protein